MRRKLISREDIFANEEDKSFILCMTALCISCDKYHRIEKCATALEIKKSRINVIQVLKSKMNDELKKLMFECKGASDGK